MAPSSPRRGLRAVSLAALALCALLLPDEASADDDPSQLLREGHALRKQGRHAEAAEAYARAIQADPDNDRAHLALGNALFSLGDHERAARSFVHAASINPGDPDPHINLCNALRITRDLDAAVGAGETAVRLAPRSAIAHLNLANAHQAKGDFDAAIRSYRTVLDIDPASHIAHANVGAVLLAQHKLRSAAQAFQRAIDLQPGFAVAHLNLGNAYKALGDYARAEASYRRATELDPASPTAYNNLGAVVAATGRQREAALLYGKALEVRPGYEPAERNLKKTTISADYGEAVAEEQAMLRARAADVEALGDSDLTGAAQLAAAFEVLRVAEMSDTPALWSQRAEEMPAVVAALAEGDTNPTTMAAFAWGGVWAGSLLRAFALEPVRKALLQAQRAGGQAVVLGSSIGFEAFFIALTYGVPTVGVELLEGLVDLSRRARQALGIRNAAFVHANAAEWPVPSATRVVYVDDAAWDAQTARQVAGKLAEELRSGAVVLHSAQGVYDDLGAFEHVGDVIVETSWDPRHTISVQRRK